MPTSNVDLREQQFEARQEVRGLRRAVFEEHRLEDIPALVVAEKRLKSLSDDRARAEQADRSDDGRIIDAENDNRMLGPNTTGIEARAELRMASVPTSIVHLFDSRDHPLVTYRIKNTHLKQTKRLKITSFVEGYSAHAVDTIEIAPNCVAELAQLPTFFRERLMGVTELTRATLNVAIVDLGGQIEQQKTVPIWLLARTTAPLQVRDPASGSWKDLTPYLGAYVTPNMPSIMTHLRKAASNHPRKRLVGYQLGEEEVRSQVEAVFHTLAEAGIVYVNSIIEFTPDNDASNQRVRLPRESLADCQANCIDGTLLFASLLEAISINAAIVMVPGHAFVAWETWVNNNNFRYLETTMLSTDSFVDACNTGEQTARSWMKHDQSLFTRWSMRDLRARGITPCE